MRMRGPLWLRGQSDGSGPDRMPDNLDTVTYLWGLDSPLVHQFSILEKGVSNERRIRLLGWCS